RTQHHRAGMPASESVCKVIRRETFVQAEPLTTHVGIGTRPMPFGTRSPFCTAGRAAMLSYQRLTLGYGFMSMVCHSKREIQGQMAISAIEYWSATNSRPSRRVLRTL